MIVLEDILAHRKWLRRSWPFPHVVARNVFKAEFYNAMARQLQQLLEQGLSETPVNGKFSRNISGYDAYGTGFNQAIPEPIAVFLSKPWRDMMCALFGITPTPYVFAGTHHHTVGSENGFIHNDFNPVWFPLLPGDHIQIPNNQLCTYKTGDGPLKPSEKVQVVRGAVVIFYLLNDGWQPGDGGETGLYTSARSNVSEPALRCPPENNSLIMYECTPYSFHSFVTNHRQPRTSIIMWVHRPLEEAIAAFDEAKLERWKS
ncbi:MAG TPA: 2OG-Fe(II) oxygenase [Pyrinomonadaceae bacterium]|nr:2OG-Fe(II) oxygenase [Pyrinomonadaceae bacterium]